MKEWRDVPVQEQEDKTDNTQSFAMGIAKRSSFVVMRGTERTKKEKHNLEEASGVGSGPLTYGVVQAIIRTC